MLKLAHYQNYCIDSKQILHGDKDHWILFAHKQMVDGGHFQRKIDKLPILSNGFTDHHEIW